MKRVTAGLLASLMAAGCSTQSVVKTEPWPAAGNEQRALPAKSIYAAYALPKALYTLHIARTKCAVKISADQTATYVADPDKRYILQYNPADFATDTLAVETDAAGLLKSVNAQSEDQSAAALASVIDLARTIATSRTSWGKEPIMCDPDDNFDVAIAFDPAAPGKANDALSRLLAPGFHATIAPAENTKVHPVADCLPEGQDGICFRALTMFDIAVVTDQYVSDVPGVRMGRGTRENTTRVFSFLAPDPGQVFFVPLNRRGPAKLDIKLTFDHGMLTKVDGTHVSKVMGAVQWPAEIVKSVLGLTSSSTSGSKAK